MYFFSVFLLLPVFSLCSLQQTRKESETPKISEPKNPPNQKTALITGITGQDGSYLAELLLDKNYIVHGILRRSSSLNTGRIDHIYESPQQKNKRFFLHYSDLVDSNSLTKIIEEVQPDEVYNLAAQSHVMTSFEIPEYTAEVVAVGTLRLLDAIRVCGLEKKTRFYQASSSELFGKIAEKIQSEKTPFYPRSPYAVSKLFAYWMVVNYREAYGMYAVNGILFNHESPRRGETFVTRKITIGIANVKKDDKAVLYLGNLNAERDWGHAKDYVEGMWEMLQQKSADDYVLASGEKHSVREFVEKAFSQIGEKIIWKGSGLDEIGVDEKTNKIRVQIDPRYFRPAEVELLHGDAAKARKTLQWQPKISFDALVKEMVASDLAAAQ